MHGQHKLDTATLAPRYGEYQKKDDLQSTIDVAKTASA